MKSRDINKSRLVGNQFSHCINPYEKYPMKGLSDVALQPWRSMARIEIAEI